MNLPYKLHEKDESYSPEKMLSEKTLNTAVLVDLISGIIAPEPTYVLDVVDSWLVSRQLCILV
jgi:hypothetical protein